MKARPKDQHQPPRLRPNRGVFGSHDRNSCIPLSKIEVLPEPWKRLNGESSQHYELFCYWLSLKPNERSFKYMAKVFPMYLEHTIAVISARCKWLYRAEQYDGKMCMKGLEKSLDLGSDYLSRAQTATQKIVATLAEKVVAALEEDDDDKIKKAIEKLKPFTALLSGYGKLGEFLLQAHETFHGTKQTFDANIKGQILQWGTPIVKQVVDTTAVPEQLTYANPTTTAQ